MFLLDLMEIEVLGEEGLLSNAKLPGCIPTAGTQVGHHSLSLKKKKKKKKKTRRMTGKSLYHKMAPIWSQNLSEKIGSGSGLDSTRGAVHHHHFC